MPFDKPRLFSADGLPRTAADNMAGAELDSLRTAVESSRRERLDDDLGLSAELQVLASHLRGEADALAERYAPAAGPAAQSQRNRGSGRRWIWQGLAVGIAGLTFLAWQFGRREPAPPRAGALVPNPVVASATQQSFNPVATSAPAARVPLAPPVFSATSRDTASVDPAVLRRTQGIAEVGMDAPAVERHLPPDQVEMLRIQVVGFEKVIRKLQSELVARDAAQIDAERKIQSLQEEVAKLHKQLDDSRE